MSDEVIKLLSAEPMAGVHYRGQGLKGFFSLINITQQQKYAEMLDWLDRPLQFDIYIEYRETLFM